MTEFRDYNAAVDFVDRHVAEGRGEKIAFVDATRALSYDELRDSAARISPMLNRMGIEQENRIALVLLDTVDFPILFWGAIRAGIVPVLLNTRLTVDQYRYLFDESRAKAVFVSPELLDVVQEATEEVPTVKDIVVVGDGPASLPRFASLLASENEGAAPARTSTRFPGSTRRHATRRRRRTAWQQISPGHVPVQLRQAGSRRPYAPQRRAR